MITPFYLHINISVPPNIIMQMYKIIIWPILDHLWIVIIMQYYRDLTDSAYLERDSSLTRPKLNSKPGRPSPDWSLFLFIKREQIIKPSFSLLTYLSDFILFKWETRIIGLFSLERIRTKPYLFEPKANKRFSFCPGPVILIFFLARAGLYVQITKYRLHDHWS